MSSKWLVVALLFSAAVNMASIGTLLYLRQKDHRPPEIRFLSPAGPRKFESHRRRFPQRQSEESRITDSLRLQYRMKLGEILYDIEKQRRAVAEQLEKDSIDRAVVDKELQRLFESQLRAERLTMDHLIALKPVLTQEEWRFLIRRFEMPPRRLVRITKDRSSDGVMRETEEKRVIMLKRNKTP